MTMKNTFILNDSSTADCLAHLRNRHLDMARFREYAGKIADSLIEQSLVGVDLAESFVVIAILRSAIAMLPAALKFVPDSKVGFAGLARDKITAVAKEYYWKVPSIEGKAVLIPDPMLATGGSILHVLRKIESENPKEIRIINIICAPEGIEAIHKEFPDVKIFTAAVDKGLDNKKIIVPGLGDFGDRYFGTIE